MQKLVSVVGTTASGKSDLGIVLANKFNGEIVSCDSRQVFKGLDLGTGKVSKEEQEMAVHHLIDIINPNEYFSVSEYQKLAYNTINDILSREKRAFLVGGTGLYSRAVCEGFNMGEEEVDEELRARINTLTKEQIEQELTALGEEIPEGISPRHLARRLEKAIKGVSHKQSVPLYDVMQLVLVYPREELYRRIEERLDKRLLRNHVLPPPAICKSDTYIIAHSPHKDQTGLRVFCHSGAEKALPEITPAAPYAF